MSGPAWPTSVWILLDTRINCSRNTQKIIIIRLTKYRRQILTQINLPRRSDRDETDFFQLEKSNSTGVKSLGIRLETLKRGGNGRDRDREDENKTRFVVLACGENGRRVWAQQTESSSSPRCLSPPLLWFLVHKDRDESLIPPQLQKSNHAGVKSYGLDPNKKYAPFLVYPHNGVGVGNCTPQIRIYKKRMLFSTKKYRPLV